MKHVGSLMKRLLRRRVLRTRSSFFGVLLLAGVLLFVPRVTLAVDSAALVSVGETMAIVLAQIAMSFVGLFGKLIALITEVVLVNIMTYNGFATSSVIGAGWAVVRDVMNMGFVVVLMLIAVVTIFGGNVGSWTVKWQQQIPKLLVFAILINFSRMICAFLIDIGQVVMLTFANAIRDIAGGNIIQLFGLSDFISLDKEALQGLVADNQGLTSFDLFASAMLALIMTMMVLGTMIILTVILVYRIVVLWVLVVISPLAFFFGGAEILRSGAGDPYAEWWKRFTGAIAIGPVLVFFLWLTLSVAGQGNIAATENFPAGAPASALSGVDGATGFATNIAQPGRLLSFILGMGMLYVGFEASQKFANSLPGTASKLIQGGVKGALALGGGTALLAGGRLAGGAGSKVLLKGGTLAGRGALAGGGLALKKTGQLQSVQALRGGVGRGLTSLGAAIPGFLGGRAVSRLGTSVEQSRKQDAAKRLDAYSDQVKNYDKDQIDAGLKGNAMGPGGKMRQNAMRWKVLNSAYLRKKYAKEGRLEEIYQGFVDNGGEDAVAGDSKMAQEFAAIKKANPHILSGEDKATTLANMDIDELMKMDPEAYRDKDVQEELKKYTKYDAGAEGGGRDRTYYELMKEGKVGNRKQQEIFNKGVGGETIDPDSISDGALRNLSEDKQTPEALGALAENGRLEVLMQSPNFQIQNVPIEHLSTPAMAKKLSETVPGEAMARLQQDPEKAEVFKRALRDAISSEMVPGKAPTKSQKKMGATMVGMSGGLQELKDLGYYNDAGDGQFIGGAEDYVKEALKSNPSFLANASEDLKEDNTFSQTVIQNVNIKALNKAMRGASSPEELEKYEKLYETLETKLSNSLKSHETTSDGRILSRAAKSRQMWDRQGRTEEQINRIKEENEKFDKETRTMERLLAGIKKANGKA